MTSPEIFRNCPVCDHGEARACLQKSAVRLVRCGRCGMIYTNPVPAEFASGQYYNQAGANYYLSPAKLESDYAAVRFERELRLFRRYCQTGAVLDAGCSSGAFLHQLKTRFPGCYEILGTDVSGPPLDYAESRGVPVRRGNFPEQDFGGKRFEAVTFWAVIEHLLEPKRFIARACSVLKPDGLCFVLVPNMRSLAVRLLGSRYRYIYPQHLNYFTRRTLTRLVEDPACRHQQKRAPHEPERGNGPLSPTLSPSEGEREIVASAHTDEMRAIVETRFEVIELRSTHFNPIVIWQDWRHGGAEVGNRERGELLRRTTAYKQQPWLKPAKAIYKLAEWTLGSLNLADNLVAVLRKRG